MVRDFSVDQQKFLLKINTDLLTQITCINSISICADPHDDHLKMVNPQMDHPQLDYPQLDYPQLGQIGCISNGGGPTFLGIMIFKIWVIKNLNYPHFLKLVQLGVSPIGG